MTLSSLPHDVGFGGERAERRAPLRLGALGAGRSILDWVLRTLISVIVVAWVAGTAAFLVLQFTPGNAADLILSGEDALNLSEERRQEVVAYYGFDLPVWQQYLRYLAGVARFDFGISYSSNSSALDTVLREIAPTLQLAVSAIVVALVLAIASAIISVRTHRLGKIIVSFTELILISSPSYWLGIMLLTVFSFSLRLFPVSGADGWASLVLPTLTLALPMAGTFGQLLRPELEREVTRPYFLTSRARGRSFSGALFQHALPHAMLPLLVLSSAYFAFLIGGTVIVENLFGRPGVGRVTLSAVLTKDIPVVCAVVVLAAVSFVVVNAVMDAVLRALRVRGQ